MPRRLAPLLFAFVFAAVAPRAQPVVDGVTLGTGIVVYQGDLDANPGNGPIEFFSFSNPSLFVVADRAFGPIITETSLQVDRVVITSELVEMSVITPSLNLTAGVPINLIRPGFFRLYAGVAPMLVIPSYERVEQERLDRLVYLDFEQRGPHVVWTFPVGVMVQDVIRLGFRVVASDEFDSAVSNGGRDRDFLTFISLGYRFDLLR